MLLLRRYIDDDGDDGRERFRLGERSRPVRWAANGETATRLNVAALLGGVRNPDPAGGGG